MTSGACWLAVDGIPSVRLEAGDAFILPSGQDFRLASSLEAPPICATELFPPASGDNVVTLNGGGEAFLVGSRFAVQKPQADILIKSLPPVFHVQSEADRTGLRYSVEQMIKEMASNRPGATLMAEHLAHMMLVHALRIYLEAPLLGTGTGWFYALADARLSSALAAFHAAPAKRWTLETLARQAGISRSAFAKCFRDTVGETPMSYIARWRMLLAADRIVMNAMPLAQAAEMAGYRSESAFSSAFKRIMGASPRSYARDERAALKEHDETTAH